MGDISLESTGTSTRTFRSLAALRAFIEEHQAWGMSLEEFRRNAGTRQNNDDSRDTQFFWDHPGTDLENAWALVQHIRRSSPAGDH